MPIDKLARVRVGPLPEWLDAVRLCGGELATDTRAVDGRYVELALPFPRAALLSAQLRGLGFGGEALQVEVVPALRRDEVRAGRLAEARLRREATPGFSDARARAEGEGRFSLTPEPLALALAAGLDGASVVDACAGSGGNSLAFARAGARVTAVEIAAERRAELAHNAALFGVAERITLLPGDALVEVPRLRADVLFVDPPWSADYDKRRVPLSALPLLDALLVLDLRAYAQLWLKVPPSFVTTELPGFAVTPWFGVAAGDRQRVKFLLLAGTSADLPARALG